MTSRRIFLETLGVATAAAALPRDLLAGIRSAKLDAVGLQLYTVRALMAKDVEATLATVAGIGYREVEFAGYFNREPAALRATLDRLKLTSPSCHVGLDNVEGRIRRDRRGRQDDGAPVARRGVGARDGSSRASRRSRSSPSVSTPSASARRTPGFCALAITITTSSSRRSRERSRSSSCSRKPIPRSSTSRWMSTGSRRAGVIRSR